MILLHAIIDYVQSTSAHTLFLLCSRLYCVRQMYVHSGYINQWKTEQTITETRQSALIYLRTFKYLFNTRHWIYISQNLHASETQKGFVLRMFITSAWILMTQTWCSRPKMHQNATRDDWWRVHSQTPSPNPWGFRLPCLRSSATVHMCFALSKGIFRKRFFRKRWRTLNGTHGGRRRWLGAITRIVIIWELVEVQIDLYKENTKHPYNEI